MTREIQFRGVVKGTTDKLVYSWGCFTDENSRYYVILGVAPLEYTQVENIQSFTGLKDKNGKEIYEGDILQQGSMRGFVEWDSGGFFCVEKSGDLDELGASWLGDTPEFWEIIGNIYENADLLA